MCLCHEKVTTPFYRSLIVICYNNKKEANIQVNIHTQAHTNTNVHTKTRTSQFRHRRGDMIDHTHIYARTHVHNNNITIARCIKKNTHTVESGELKFCHVTKRVMVSSVPLGQPNAGPCAMPVAPLALTCVGRAIPKMQVFS